MNTRSYSNYEEHFCILYTDFCGWTIILIESASLGAENDNASQCGLKCAKTADSFCDVNNIEVD